MVLLNNQVNALFREVKGDKESQAKIKKAVDDLKRKQSKLEEETTRQASEQDAFEIRLKAVQELQEAERRKHSETVIEDLDSLRKTIAQLQADLLGVKENIQVLTGQIEESNYLIRDVAEKDTTKTDSMVSQLNQLSTVTEDFKSRLEILENYVSAEIEAKKKRTLSEKTLSPDQKGEKGAVPSQQRELTESELYDRALAYHRDDRHQEAMADFNTFLTLYPKSDLADNAQFWIGECYKAQGKHEEAILAYQKVIDKYPEGNKVPAAMLNQGFSFEKIDDKTTAELILKRLVKNYPKTKEAEIAQKRLQGTQ
jgi:tol-pal system protein YbgF